MGEIFALKLEDPLQNTVKAVLYGKLCIFIVRAFVMKAFQCNCKYLHHFDSECSAEWFYYILNYLALLKTLDGFVPLFHSILFLPKDY